jgi:predicted kinase
MPKVYLIEGPVGAGKSTHASALAQRIQGVHIALDDWFVALFSPDRPADHFVASWYIERKARLLDLIWNHSRRILASGADAILELGLIQRQVRSEFCSRVQEEGFELQLHVLDAPLDVRRERVRRRNAEKGATFAMVVPDHVFEMASALWETPDEAECSDYPVEFVENETVRDDG